MIDDLKICSKCTAVLADVGKSDKCPHCQVYVKNKDVLLSEVREFASHASQDAGVIVEFSGGRHSAVALSLVVYTFRLKPVALTVDNGFIPPSVLEQAKRICRDLDVRHIIVRSHLPIEKAFAKDGRLQKSLVCPMCNGAINSAVCQIAKHLSLHWSVNGENKYRTLLPTPSSLGRLTFANNYTLNTINLPYACEVNKEYGGRLLSRISWVDQGVPGLSSDCLLPWISQEGRKPLSANNVLCEAIAMEVRSGYLSRSEGLSLLMNAESASKEDVDKIVKAYHENRDHTDPTVIYDSAQGKAWGKS